MRNILIVVGSTIVTTAIACSDIANPAGPVLEPAALVAASPTVISAVVGSEVRDLPAVTVQDAAGNGIPGIPVTFLLIRGGGALKGATALSDAAGIARLGGWTLGTRPEENVVYATRGSLPPTVFRARAITGPAHKAVKIAGDNQAGLPGSHLPVKPQVHVGDAFHNGIAGVQVNYSVAGGGAVNGSSAITDSLGIATINGWQLGSGGPQTLEVRVGELEPLIFTAQLSDAELPCGSADLLKVNEQRLAELTAADCHTGAGRFFQVFSFVVAQPSRWDFLITSSDFTAAMELLDAAGKPVAESEGTTSNKNAQISALLPAGTFSLRASSVVPGATGSYAVRATEGGTQASCTSVFLTIGAVIAPSITRDRCPGDAVLKDRYRIYLAAGASITLTLRDRSYSSPYLELSDANGTVVGTSTFAAYYVETLSFFAVKGGYYTIAVMNREDEAAMYDLSVN